MTNYSHWNREGLGDGSRFRPDQIEGYFSDSNEDSSYNDIDEEEEGEEEEEGLEEEVEQAADDRTITVTATKKNIPSVHVDPGDVGSKRKRQRC